MIDERIFTDSSIVVAEARLVSRYVEDSSCFPLIYLENNQNENIEWYRNFASRNRSPILVHYEMDFLD